MLNLEIRLRNLLMVFGPVALFTLWPNIAFCKSTIPNSQIWIFLLAGGFVLSRERANYYPVLVRRQLFDDWSVSQTR